MEFDWKKRPVSRKGHRATDKATKKSQKCYFKNRLSGLGILERKPETSCKRVKSFHAKFEIGEKRLGKEKFTIYEMTKRY